jgi:hypothetical protein
VERHDGTIPANLTYAPARSQLAEVHSRFAGPASALGSSGWYDVENFDTFFLGFDQFQQLQSVRTDWVSPGQGKFRWYDEADIINVVEERSLVHSLAAGSRTSENWFSPVFRPRLNPSGNMPTRSENFMELDVPGWADGRAGDAGFDTGMWSGTPDRLHQTVTLYQGSKTIKSTRYQQIDVIVPSSRALRYRLVAAENQSSVFPTSAASRTEWDFTSGTVPGIVVLPLIQLDYRIATDLHGRAARHSAFTLATSYLPRAVGTGKIGKPTFAVSYDDGSRWTALPLRRAANGTWTTTINAPRAAAFASIRATVTDSAGNRVSQTVLRAFALK